MAQRYNNQEFVITWMHSATVEEVEKNMNMSHGAVLSKANYLRSKGVKLPKKHRSPLSDQLEIAQLNSIIIKAQKEIDKAPSVQRGRLA